MKQVDVAIIGVSGMFPGAKNVEEYWDNLKKGLVSVADIPEERWEQSKYATNDFKEPYKIYCNKGGFIKGAEEFDYEYFNMSKDEALILDPQQRVALQLTKKLFDRAGYAKRDYYGKNIAVYIGASTSASNELHGMYTRFFQLDEETREKLFDKFGRPTWHANYLPDSITNLISGRISHEFNLTGPSMVVDTACSSSLVAIHNACQLLRYNESDMAIAGGIYLQYTPASIMGFCAAGALSKSGNLRAFDDRADGFVPGEGAGLILLKRLEDAKRDNDYIYGIIRGSVINNDGHTLGIMAPNPNRQRSVITAFYNDSSISPREIDYMEAHGTGTKIGDLSEFNSLSQVFKKWDVPNRSVALGSVKSNIGHAISASGIASVVKIIGMMQNNTIFKQANYEVPNKKLKVEDSPFYIPTETKKIDELKYAAINSFGFGGTNAHIIIENGLKYNSVESEEMKCFPLMVGAHNRETIVRRKEQILESMKNNDVWSVAHKLNKISEDEKFILPFIVNNGKLVESKEDIYQREEKKIAFLFTGQGSQYLKMAKALYDSNPVFRNYLNKCSSLFEKEIGVDVTGLLYEKEEDIVSTERAQAIIFSVGYSLGKMLLDADVTPKAMLGHSIGEWIAAALAEVVTLEEAVKIVSARGTIMKKCNGKGTMVAVFVSDRAKLDPIVEKNKVFYSAFNISHIVVGGEKSKIKSFLENLQKEGLMYKELPVASAFHTPIFDEAAKEFGEALKNVEFKEPKIPIVGNVTGEFVENYSIDYWTDHLIKPVRFEEDVEKILEDKIDVGIECGGNAALLNMVKSKYSDFTGIPLLSPKSADNEVFCEGLIEISKVSKSFSIDKCFLNIPFKNIDLPEYPFQGITETIFKSFGRNNIKHVWEWKETEIESADDGSEELTYKINNLDNISKENIVRLYADARDYLSNLKQDKEKDYKVSIVVDENVDANNYSIQYSVACFMLSFISNIRNVKGCILISDSKNPKFAFADIKILRQKNATYYERALVDASSEQNTNFDLHDQVVLITGGNGNLGKNICDYLLGSTECKIVTLSRKGGTSDNPRIIPFKCDVSDYEQLSNCRAEIEKTVGKVDVIFHLAGVLNRNGICTMDDDIKDIQAVLAPKVLGTMNLSRVWKEDELQLMVLLSSISATDPKWSKGLADYAAGNAFLNAFAEKTDFKALGLNYALMKTEDGIEKNIEDVDKEQIMHSNGLTLLDMEQVVISFFEGVENYTVNTNIHVFEKYEEQKQNVAVKEEAKPQEQKAIASSVETTHATEVIKPKVASKKFTKEDFFSLINEFLDVDVSTDNEQENFMDLGLDSLKGIKMIAKIKDSLGKNIYPTVVFEYQTPEQLYQYIEDNILESADDVEVETTVETTTEEKEDDDKSIAIVGVALRAPQVTNIDELWDVVKNKKVVLSEINKSHFSTSVSSEKWVGGEIKDAYNFDPMFFGVSPSEARYMDPQQRTFLKVTYEAMQDGNIISDSDSKVGVYVGAEQNNYAEQFNNGRYIKAIEDCLKSGDSVEKIARILSAASMKSDAVPGNSLNELAARVSYTFGLKGPSMVLNTACSSSLVALSVACGDLRNGKVKAAVVGGVNMNLSDTPYMSMTELGALSKTNSCRPFDEKADGMMLGEAVVSIVLKRKKDAVENGDYIYGLIKDVTTNNNGSTQGITVPTVNGEKEVMSELIEQNPEVPGKIKYIDAHGTATPLGDPVEISSIQKAYGDYVDDTVYIGSSKGNFGHPLAASGLLSLVKCLAILEHDEIPPVAGLVNRSKYVELEKNFELAVENKKINEKDYCVGVNAFGFGGTNAHVVIGKYINDTRENVDFPVLLTFSAYSENGLKNNALSIKETILNHKQELGGVIRKINQNSKQFAYKVALVAESAEDLISKLEKVAAGDYAGVSYGCERKKKGNVAMDGDRNDTSYLNTLAEKYIQGFVIDYGSQYRDYHTKNSFAVYSEQEYRANKTQAEKVVISRIEFKQRLTKDEAEKCLREMC